MCSLLNHWAASKGAEFGSRLADPHVKKPRFVFTIAVIVIGLGGWLAWHFRASSEPLFWTGVGVMAFGGIGIIRGILLLFGKDFE
ncbi:MAG: hypothetical protein AB7T27_01840 [Kiritimatiellia bacterium]